MRPHLARVATLATLAVALLAGCMRADADLVVDADTDTVTGAITLAAPLTEDSDAARQAAAAVAVAIESQALPGLREVGGVSAEVYQGEGYYGTRLVLAEVPLDELYLGARAETSQPLITRDGNTYTVAGTIDALADPAVAAGVVEGERPAGAAESQITIALTFPGEVESVAGTVDAATVTENTVTWQSSWDTVLVLEATAAASQSMFPPWIWQAVIWGAIGIAVLALLGLITVWVRSRND